MVGIDSDIWGSCTNSAVSLKDRVGELWALIQLKAPMKKPSEEELGTRSGVASWRLRKRE